MDRYKLTKSAAVSGIAANIFLLAIKLAAGIVSKSQAMIADGFNSAGDVFASVMTYTGNKIAEKPEDETHPYGHGKAEYIFSMIISFSLLIVAFRIAYGSIGAIIARKTFVFSWWLVSVALLTIAIKLVLFVYTSKMGKKMNNLLLVANSEDHRNDVFVTSSTLLGIVFGFFGIYWLDGLIGFGISLWIAYTGVRIFRSSYRVLMDTNADKALIDDIMKVIESVEGIDHTDDVIAKPTGFRYIIIVKVSVSGAMTVNESHGIAAQLRKSIRELPHVADVVVHINPA